MILGNLAIGFVLSIIIGVIGIVAACVISVATAIPTYFLWNWLMPGIFGLKTITFWQAWGINFLAGILFKGSLFSLNLK